VAPLFASGAAEYVGEINDAQKPCFLSGARALLFPIAWPEPFGLVMIEAMACGCPWSRSATARAGGGRGRGDGLHRRYCRAGGGACARLDRLDRATVRARFEARWTARRMARDYVALYEQLIRAGQGHSVGGSAATSPPSLRYGGNATGSKKAPAHAYAQIAPLSRLCRPSCTAVLNAWCRGSPRNWCDGHEVTLFASGDSVTTAKLEPTWPQALRLDPTILDWFSTYYVMLDHVFKHAHKFDILHFHIDYFPNLLFRHQPVPFLTTLHGRLDLPELGVVYRTFPDVPLVSISNSQRKPIPDVNWIARFITALPRIN